MISAFIIMIFPYKSRNEITVHELEYGHDYEYISVPTFRNISTFIITIVHNNQHNSKCEKLTISVRGDIYS